MPTIIEKEKKEKKLLVKRGLVYGKDMDFMQKHCFISSIASRESVLYA